MAGTTKVLGWGKCSAVVTPASGTASTFEDIVDGSASLSVEEGEEMEALIEGGEAEGRRKRPDKYILTFNRRIGDASEVTGKLGYTESVTSVQVIPELNGAIGVTLSDVSETFTVQYDTTDGLVAVYTYKTKGKTDANGKINDVTFAAKSA